MTSRGLTIASVLFCLSCLIGLLGRGASVAEAHLGHEVQTAERYLKIDFGEDHVRVVVSLMLGPGEARRVLSAADRDSGDGDGVLTAAEAAAYMELWGEGLAVDLPIELDGAPAASRWGESYLDPVGPISARPATVEMVARLPLGPGRHQITLRDGMRRETFDRTDVAFRAREGAELIVSGVGEAPGERVSAFAFAGDQGPELLTAVAEVPGGGVEETAPSNDDGALPWVWVGAAVGLIALLGAYALRRSRGRPPRSGTGS